MNTEAVPTPIFIIPRASSTHWQGGAQLDRSSVRYASYWENDCGEMLIFFVDMARKPWLLHSDCGSDPMPLKTAYPVGLLLADEERGWLDACWKASEWKRNKHDTDQT